MRREPDVCPRLALFLEVELGDDPLAAIEAEAMRLLAARNVVVRVCEMNVVDWDLLYVQATLHPRPYETGYLMTLNLVAGPVACFGTDWARPRVARLWTEPLR